MQQLPLVGAEVQRIGAAFATASQELSGAVHRLGDLPIDTVGTPSCDPAIAAGLRDLRTALARIQATAEECVAVLTRHSAPDPAVPPPPRVAAGAEDTRPGQPA